MQQLIRRTHESVMVGDDVEITVMEVDGDTVKLAISAPNGVGIHESEVYVRLERSKHLGAVKEHETE